MELETYLRKPLEQDRIQTHTQAITLCTESCEGGGIFLGHLINLFLDRYCRKILI
jgi:hypothetical protein